MPVRSVVSGALGLARRRRLTLVTCCSVHSLQDGLTDLVYVLLPLLAQSLGLTYAQVGTLRAANRGAMALFEIPSGMLSERLGERALIGFGLLCGGAGYLALAGASGYESLLICLFAAGTGAAFQHSLCSSVISKTFEGGARRIALGTYNSSGDIGKLAVTALFTLLVGLGLAWQAFVAGLGAVALIAAVAVVLMLGRLGVGGPLRTDELSGGSARLPARGLRRPGAFAALMAIVFFDIAVQAGFLTFLAFVMMAKEVPASLGAFAVVLTLSGGVVGKFACGHLAARLGVVRSLVAVECATAAGILAVLALPTLPAYCILPLVGAALQGSSTIAYGTVGDLVEEARHSRSFAMVYSTASLAGILAPLGFGLIGDHFGLTTAMLSMACVTLLPVPLILLIRRQVGGAVV